MKDQETSGNKRRKLLSLGFLGVVSIGLGSFFGRFIKFNNNQPVKLLLPNGKLVIVEKKHLPKHQKHQKISNQKLKQWMKGEHQV